MPWSDRDFLARPGLARGLEPGREHHYWELQEQNPRQWVRAGIGDGYVKEVDLGHEFIRSSIGYSLTTQSTY